MDDTLRWWIQWFGKHLATDTNHRWLYKLKKQKEEEVKGSGSGGASGRHRKGMKIWPSRFVVVVYLARSIAK